MTFSNLDTIIRRQLLELSLPIHYYAELLFHTSAAIRELSFDSMRIINSARLPVNDYGAIDLPTDFVDDVSAAIPIGGTLNPIPRQTYLNPIRIHSTTTGDFQQYTSDSDNGQAVFFGFPSIWSWYWNINDYGEPTGRFFGARGGTNQGYQLFRERNQIQFSDNFVGSNVVLLYISDGQQADNATNVDTMAIATLHAYANWKRSPNAAFKDSPEAATYYNERRLYRARKNDLDRITLVNIMRNGYTASIKS